MSYRDAVESLRARRERVATELEAARKAASEAQARARRIDALEAELAETDDLLRRVGARRGLPVLEDVQIAAPCDARWEHMTGDARVRFCGQCSKNVYDLSAMPRAEAELLLQEKEGALCVRLHRRADGTVITADCPVGVRKRRRRRLAAAAVGGGLMAAAAAAFASQRTQGECSLPPAPTATMTAMGVAAVPEEPPAVPEMGSAAPRPPSPPAEHVVMGRRKR